MTGTQTFVIVMTCIFTTSAWYMWRSYQARKSAEAEAKAEIARLEAQEQAASQPGESEAPEGNCLAGESAGSRQGSTGHGRGLPKKGRGV